MTDSLMLAHIYSLPEMTEQVARTFDHAARETYSHELCLSAKRIWLVGCGDGHHAAQAMEMLFSALTGVPTTAMTALKFSRYAATFLPHTGPNTNLVIGISSSGKTSRTMEALRVAPNSDATTIAITHPESALARSASVVQPMIRPPVEGRGVPGVRSYMGMLLALSFAALRIGEVRGRIAQDKAATWRNRLRGIAPLIKQTIENCNEPAKDLAQRWLEHDAYVFLGSGPNWGTALVAGAHMLEATGDTALCFEVEEWAHLQYWNRKPQTPTFVISASERDGNRAVEVAAAVRGLGHPMAAVVPVGEHTLSPWSDVTLSFANGLPEELTPFVDCIPTMLFTAHRADLIGEPYFRRGSRHDAKNTGESSRVQSSEMIDQIIPWNP